jgi:hypothetical protein
MAFPAMPAATARPSSAARSSSRFTALPAARRALPPLRAGAGDEVQSKLDVSLEERLWRPSTQMRGEVKRAREEKKKRHAVADPRPSINLIPSSFTQHPLQAKPSPAAAADDDLWIERELRRRAKKRAAVDKGSGPTVVAPAVAKARATAAGEGTALDAAEIGYRRFLGAFGAFILLEGLVLGGSGFLPDAWDAWISGSLYPSFSPTVGIFLVFSSAYGVWKAKQGDGGGE